MQYGDKMENITNEKRKEIQISNEFKRTGDPEKIILSYIESIIDIRNEIERLKTRIIDLETSSISAEKL